ncbi:MAG TPA: four helix bundle protein [Chloroflexota bacterium]|nr:four helix bundle protein [Chloroflexota bacterium]
MSEPSPRTRHFTDVAVWQKAHRWVLDVYRFSEGFPRQETFGLTAQLRRAAISIPANFAEGYKKRSTADKARFFNISQGSLEECRYYLILAQDLGYGDTCDLAHDLDQVSRMLDAYIRAMVARQG